MLKKCLSTLCFGILALGIATIMPGAALAKADRTGENPLLVADSDKGSGFDKEKIREMKERGDDWKKEVKDHERGLKDGKRHFDRPDTKPDGARRPDFKPNGEHRPDFKPSGEHRPDKPL